MKLGDSVPAQYDLRKLRLLGSVGEPINPGGMEDIRGSSAISAVPVVDTWWQTETGSIMMTPCGSGQQDPAASVTRHGLIFADSVCHQVSTMGQRLWPMTR